MLKINGIEIKTPTTFSVDIQDIDGETNRNASGTLYRDRICTKIKLNCEWKWMTNAEIATLLNAVRDVFFTVEYPSPLTGGITSGTFYVGDRSAPMYSCVNNIPRWEGLSMNFIER